MTQRKSAILRLVIFISLLLTFATAVFLKTHPPDLLIRLGVAMYVLKEAVLQPPMPPSSELFRDYVLDPIPASVTEIRCDRHQKIYARGYTFKFNVNKSDLALIINSRPFQRVLNAEYRREIGLHLRWNPHFGQYLAVYGPGAHKPAWFTLESWDNPEAYAFQTGGSDPNTQVLLHDAELGQAYFIVHDRGR